ncbi:MAG: hypothetical protein ACR2NM_07155 [Bythopirellula sp.]
MNKLSITVALVAFLVPAVASAVSLEATYDSWIRAEDAGFDFNGRDNDFVSVWDSTTRYGALEFDLSSIGVPITSAHLQLWNQANGFSDDFSAIVQTASLIDGTWVNPAGGGAAGVGLLDFAGTETAIAGGNLMTGLGDLNILAQSAIPGNLNGGSYINTTATAGDLAALNADAAGDDLATFVLSSLGGNHSWGDNNTLRARLTINEAPIPDPTVPTPVFDAIWARADSSHYNDGVLVSDNPATIAGAPTVGLMEWDLAQLYPGKNPADLLGATLELFVADESRTQNPGQTAKQIDLNGTPLISTANEPSYTVEYGGFGNALGGLGVVPNLGAGLVNGDGVLTTATAADLDLIKGVMNGSGMLSLEMRSDSSETGQYWGDGAFGIEPILTLVFPGEFSLQVNSTTGEMWIANPSGDPADDMDFDIDGYVISSPDGSLNPDGFTGLVGAGETGWEVVAPTDGAISELNLTSSTLFSEGDSISLGTGYTPGAAEDAGLTFEYSLTGSDTTMFGFVHYVTGAGTDADGDGDVDGNDFLMLQRTNPSLIPQWEIDYGTEPLAASQAVPEPSVWLLMCFGFPSLTTMMRRPS